MRTKLFIVLLIAISCLTCSSKQTSDRDSDSIIGSYEIYTTYLLGMYHLKQSSRLYFYADSVLVRTTCSGPYTGRWYVQKDVLYYSYTDASDSGGSPAYKQMKILRNGHLRQPGVRLTRKDGTTLTRDFLYKKINNTPPDSLLQAGME